ncbi:toll-like receptor 3, partial [Anabrus simplex]|uniref:toll-like receptor 3 n=1 Tax=Anabrus simplex TaxID=316456 RepID=UPI0035A37F4D
LKVLDLSSNKLTNWPALYDFAFIRLDMSHNLLLDVYNLGSSGTTVQNLNLSNNRISFWEDKYVFSLQKFPIPHDEQRYQLSANRFTSGSAKMNHYFKISGLPSTQISELSIPLHSGSHRKLLNHISENISLLNNLYGKTELPKGDSDQKITVNNFENTFEYSSPMKSHFWVKKLEISSNLIFELSETMIQSLDGIHQVDLGGNPFLCVGCRLIPFQKWLNTTSTIVSNLGTSDPLVCSAPDSVKGTPVNLVQIDEEPCLEKVRTTSLLTLIGVPLLTVAIMIVAIAGTIYKCRSKIGYYILIINFFF